MADINNVQKPITWQEIEPLILDAKYKEFFKNIDPETFKLVLDESNKSKIVESLSKMLLHLDPDNANDKYIEQLLSFMKETADAVFSTKET